jgi:hypothetical protein
VPKAWPCPPVHDLESDSGEPHAIDIAFQYRWRAIPPRREHEDEAFGAEKTVHVRLDISPVWPNVVVESPLIPGENRLKAFGVKIAIIDVMSCLRQSSNNVPMNGGLKTVVDRMGVDNKESHLDCICLSRSGACVCAYRAYNRVRNRSSGHL